MARQRHMALYFRKVNPTELMVYTGISEKKKINSKWLVGSCQRIFQYKTSRLPKCFNFWNVYLCFFLKVLLKTACTIDIGNRDQELCTEGRKNMRTQFHPLDGVIWLTWTVYQPVRTRENARCYPGALRGPSTDSPLTRRWGER